MDPFEFVVHIPCPHCRVGVGERCVTKDGYERKIPCLYRVKLAKWPDAEQRPDVPPDSSSDH
jgi:hypothetical protein